MTKKMMKILSTMLIAIMMMGIVATPVLATGTFSVGDSTGYNPSGTQSATSDKAGNIMNSIIGVVQVIGIAIAVIMLIFVAIKYLTSAPNDKAEIKKHAVVYVVGAIVLFGASGILGIIKQFAGQL